jgi:hypothetical protein
MKAAGYVLLTIGFLGGSFVTSTTPENSVNWLWFLPAFGLGVAGVVLAWLGRRQVASDTTAATGNMETLRDNLDQIVEKITRLDAEKESFHPYEVHGKIDELFPHHLTEFVDARESIAHVHGLQAYAAVMNEFAAGERYLNRVWSASVDCYIDDVREYLGRSKEQFEKARDQLAAL